MNQKHEPEKPEDVHGQKGRLNFVMCYSKEVKEHDCRRVVQYALTVQGGQALGLRETLYLRRER